MKAFCGFGCSFGGKWFGGYGGPSKHHPTGLAIYTRNSLLKSKNVSVELKYTDFLLNSPSPCNYLIYCDIPYEGTTGYSGGPKFDRQKFIQLVIKWAEFTDIFVSEYEFPLGQVMFEVASKTKVNAGMSGKVKQAVERLYHIPKQS
jgi:DNA adenine methylase